MTDNSRRLVIGALLPGLAFLAAIVTTLVTSGSLPDPIATHWELGGGPDGSTGRTTFVVLFLGLVTAVGLVIAVVSRRRNPSRGEFGPTIGVATFIQWLLVGITVMTLVANVDASSWQEARNLPLPVAFLAPALAAAVAAWAAKIANAIGEPIAGVGIDSPTIDTKPGERVAWFGHLSSPWLMLLGGLIGSGGIALLLVGSRTVGVLVLLAAFAISSVATIHVTADTRGLTVRYGPLGWPRTRISLDQIEHADVIDVRPGRHGGWGYRGSLRVLGRASLVLRAGEGLQVDLRDGRRFVVTIDGAATGAGTLNDLVA